MQIPFSKDRVLLLSLEMEKNIQRFDVSKIPAKQFSLMMKQSFGLVKEHSHDEYVSLKDEVTTDTIVFADSIISGIELIIAKIKSGLDYKAKNGQRCS